jgi:PBP1b-binding outer membrane lipoprotein LpoB
MKRVLPILLIAFLLGGCYTEFLTTESEDTTDSTWYTPPPPPPPLPPEPIIILVPGPADSPAAAPNEARRDFGSTRGSTEQSSMGRSSSGGKTEGRGR